MTYFETALKLLHEMPAEARIVGGAVRDMQLGKQPKDIDITTVMLPNEVIDWANKNHLRTIPTGIEHGTITVIYKDYAFEITTLRQDVSTDGRRATVAFTNDFRVDAERRDFTFNALSMDKNQRVYDYFGGIDDLARGIVRYIGDPSARITEDYLRILRYFRFHAYYGKGDVDLESLRASLDLSPNLDKISAERKWAEISKILKHDNAYKTFKMMDDGSLLPYLFGYQEVENMKFMHGFNPLIKLAAMSVFCTEHADQLKEWFKMSNEEHKFLFNIAKDLTGKFDKEHLYRVGKDMFLHQAMVAWHQKRISSEVFFPAEKMADEWKIPTFPLQASDFMFAGMKEGKQLGQALKRAERKWIDNGFSYDRVALIKEIMKEVE